MPVDPILQERREQRDVTLEPDATANLHEIGAAYAAEFRIVQDQIGQLGARLDEIQSRQAGDASAEVVDAEHVAHHVTGVVEAQRLVEVAHEQVMLACHRKPLREWW